MPVSISARDLIAGQQTGAEDAFSNALKAGPERRLRQAQQVQALAAGKQMDANAGLLAAQTKQLPFTNQTGRINADAQLLGAQAQKENAGANMLGAKTGAATQEQAATEWAYKHGLDEKALEDFRLTSAQKFLRPFFNDAYVASQKSLPEEKRVGPIEAAVKQAESLINFNLSYGMSEDSPQIKMLRDTQNVLKEAQKNGDPKALQAFFAQAKEAEKRLKQRAVPGFKPADLINIPKGAVGYDPETGNIIDNRQPEQKEQKFVTLMNPGTGEFKLVNYNDPEAVAIAGNQGYSIIMDTKEFDDASARPMVPVGAPAGRGGPAAGEAPTKEYFAGTEMEGKSPIHLATGVINAVASAAENTWPFGGIEGGEDESYAKTYMGAMQKRVEEAVANNKRFPVAQTAHLQKLLGNLSGGATQDPSGLADRFQAVRDILVRENDDLARYINTNGNAMTASKFDEHSNAYRIANNVIQEIDAILSAYEREEAGGAEAEANQGQAPAATQVNSQAEYDALPSGTLFTWNGQTYTKR